MSKCSVALNCAIPNRFSKEEMVNGALFSVVFTGNTSDTSNFSVSSLVEYDPTKDDYKIGDRVKVDGVKTEYICGIEGTRIHPLFSSGAEWKKIGSTNEFKFKDGSPNSQSLKSWDASSPNIEIELELGASNFLFMQNLKNIKEIVVESMGASDVEIHREDTYKLARFSPCSCCLIRYEYENNFTLMLDSCGNYERIKITLVPRNGTISGVGVCSAGQYIEVGKFHDYPIPNIQSDFKFEIEEQGLALPVNTSVFMNYSFTLEELNTDSQNYVYEKLINNVASLNFYEITNLKNNMFTKFVGTHKGFKPKITDRETTSISIDIYAIPTKDKGVS